MAESAVPEGARQGSGPNGAARAFRDGVCVMAYVRMEARNGLRCCGWVLPPESRRSR